MVVAAKAWKTVQYEGHVIYMISVYFLLFCSYLLGSIPFGLILAYLVSKQDIRLQGSGNIGATNAYRVAGKLVGLLTLILDLFKGSVAVILATKLVPENELIGYIAGFLAFFGHVYPVWLGFKGGKGVATALGVVLVLFPKLALIAVFSWATAFAMFRIVSFASVFTSAICIGAIWLTAYHLRFLSDHTYEKSFIISSIFLIVIVRHQANIRRMLNNTEKKL
jgi:glycerol-3-phosphate acyltransferase PlsY